MHLPIYEPESPIGGGQLPAINFGTIGQHFDHIHIQYPDRLRDFGDFLSTNPHIRFLKIEHLGTALMNQTSAPLFAHARNQCHSAGSLGLYEILDLIMSDRAQHGGAEAVERLVLVRKAQTSGEDTLQSSLDDEEMETLKAKWKDAGWVRKVEWAICGERCCTR